MAIDQCTLASFAEIEEPLDGVRSFEELEELFSNKGMYKNWADSSLSSLEAWFANESSSSVALLDRQHKARRHEATLSPEQNCIYERKDK